jgi:predicted Abi (CAAX) family protease
MKREKTGIASVVVPLGCALGMVVVIALPFFLLTLLALQAGLPREGVWIMVGVVAVALDAIALMQLGDRDLPREVVRRRRLVILAVPFIGALYALAVEYRDGD